MISGVFIDGKWLSGTDESKVTNPATGETVAVIQTGDTDHATDNLSRAYRVAEQLEYGIIGMNDALPSTAQAPFGGMKQSGVGREGGHYGIEAFLETKFVSIGLWTRQK